MRLLVYFRARLAVNRGTPLRCRNLVAALSENVEIDLRLLSGDDTAELQSILPVDHRQLPPDAENWTDALISEVESFKPDLVYGQTHKAMRDMVYLNGPNRPKLVVDLHGDYPAERLEQYWRPLPRRVLSFAKERFLERRTLARMDAFTTVSHTLAADIESYNKPIHVLWGGVNPELFKPLPRPEKDVIQVTYAGNYSPYQGVQILVQAARRLVEAEEPFHFNFIGNIDQFPELRKDVEQYLAGRCSIVGQVDYREMPHYLSQADILVIPRITDRAARYGFPSKLPEYLATGRALVITDVGEHARVVENGRTGLVVPPDSPSALAEALLKLKDRELRERLGRDGRAFAEQHLAWSSIGKTLHNFFVELIASEAVST